MVYLLNSLLTISYWLLVLIYKVYKTRSLNAVKLNHMLLVNGIEKIK